MHVKKATHKMHGRGQEMSMSEEINYKKEKRRERLSQKKLERAAAGRKNTKNKKNKRTNVSEKLYDQAWKVHLYGNLNEGGKNDKKI
jgi:hypothetical protein